jgi:hypothetical protein
MSMLNATPLQAFAAGAALCSTSLGTTFTILGTSGLSSTRLGVVLTSAAMMDDVVGLIMVQVISNLGGDSFDAITVVRPVMVSLAFAIVIPILCRFIVVPVTVRLNSYRAANPSSMVSKLFGMNQTALVIHTGYLLGVVIGATFAGTSSLLAAYIAGATISWWDSEVPHLEWDISNATAGESEQTSTTDPQTMKEPSVQTPSPKIMEGGSGAEIFHRYYEHALQRLLKPFFFVSPLPITSRTDADIPGFHRLLCSYHPVIHRAYSLAWCHLYDSNDICKARLWAMAYFLRQSFSGTRAVCSENHAYAQEVLKDPDSRCSMYRYLSTRRVQ